MLWVVYARAPGHLYYKHEKVAFYMSTHGGKEQRAHRTKESRFDEQLNTCSYQNRPRKKGRLVDPYTLDMLKTL